MDRPMYIRHRSRRVITLPAIVWVGLALFLLGVGVGIGELLLRSSVGDWLELKMESAQYHLLELLPQPDHPDFVPTPIVDTENRADTSKVAWSANPPDAGTTHDPSATLRTATDAEATSGMATETPQAVPVIADEPSPTASTTKPTNAGATNAPAPIPAESVELQAIQPSVQLTGVIPEAQRFNNCGPTTLRMYFSFYGYTKDTQVQIANVLKPNTQDKNVSPYELVGYAESRGFHAIARVNGSLDRIKQTLSNGLPIMIEEGYDPPRANKGWMGHYLLITGYDAQGITAQDSYDGPNQHVSWQDLDANWRNFNRTYLLVYPPEQEAIIRSIVGDDWDDATMYSKAAQRAQDEWNANPKDAFAAFNLGSSLVGLGEYEAAAQAFDQARILKLPWRMLWYQFGPYEAYYRVGRYQEVVALADATQKGIGDLEEAYYYKGLALEKLGQVDAARASFQLALKYNPNYQAAQEALKEVS